VSVVLNNFAFAAQAIVWPQPTPPSQREILLHSLLVAIPLAILGMAAVALIIHGAWKDGYNAGYKAGAAAQQPNPATEKSR
jgi:hypothetical protein